MRASFLYVLLVLLTVSWGLNVIAIKIVVSQFSAVTITALRIMTAFLAIAPFLYYRKIFRTLPKSEMLSIVAIAVFGVLGHQYFLSVGLEHTTAANGGLILGTVPIATSIAAAIFLGDRLTASRIIGLLLGFFGVAMIVLAKSSGVLTVSFGDLYVCLAVVTQAISFILIKRLSENVDSAYITSLSQLFGALMLFTLSLGLEPEGLQSLSNGTTTAWLVFLASGIISTGLGHLVYNHAIQEIGAGKSALFLNLTPFFSLVGAYFFFGEKILISQALGFILIVSGVLLGTGAIEQVWSKRKKVKGKAGHFTSHTN
ncbi:DMT family transporter [Lederbergia citrea]|uniref:DMT family transporter n=1 Tax=Lederbergia citrea TaxID=2833581 RepID=UPI001BCA3B59|nr:DMT family transporter [Lederbergia citrea]MBS4177584.1 DMT family transporter [Lederbergia citrea]